MHTHTYSGSGVAMLSLAAKRLADDVCVAQCVTMWQIVLCAIIQKGYDNRKSRYDVWKAEVYSRT